MAFNKSPPKVILRSSYEYLVNELRATTYLDALLSEGVISPQDRGALLAEQEKHEQSRKLLDLLLYKPEENVRKFYEILKTRLDKQPHIYKHLFPGEDEVDGTQQPSILPKEHDIVPATEVDPESDSKMADSDKEVPKQAFLAKNGYKYDVFLCHAGENKTLVSKLYWQLCSRNILPFLDELSLEIGDDGHEVMMEAVERTARFIAPVVTHELKGKPWPQIEIEKALVRHKKDRLVVLPVFLVDPDKLLGSTVEVLREIGKISGTKKHDGEQEDDFVMRVSKAIEKRIKNDTRICSLPPDMGQEVLEPEKQKAKGDPVLQVRASEP
jgi:hypothetical protein